MQSGLNSLTGGLGLIFCLLLSAWPVAAQNTPQDHVQVYKRAVSAIDGAEKKLAGNYTAEAKAFAKEANSLFSILRKELKAKAETVELSPQQDEQFNVNNKLGEDSTAQGEKLDKSAKEKQQKADTMEAQGQQDMAVKLQQEAVRDSNLATKAFLKAEIYHLRNLQLSYSFLNK
jgi:hypothetical protein